MANEEIKNEEQVDVQKRYLMAKIDELINGVGPGYGEALMEELISRMERTVGHFHEELTGLLETLKSRAQEQNEKLKSLMTEKETDVVKETEKPISSAEQEMSEWEKKLETLDDTKKGELSEKKPPLSQKEEVKPTKKSIFGYKKK